MASAQPSEASPPAKANVGAEPVEANRQENSDAQEALAIGMKPSFGVRTILGVDRGTATGELFLEVNNTSGWTARDVRLEVHRRDGHVDVETRSRMQPDRHFEPRWNLLLRGVKPASVDVFAEVRDQIERVVLTYSDERDIGRYALSLPTADIGEPFDAEQGAERRIR